VAANIEAVRRALSRRPGRPYQLAALPSESKPEGENKGARSAKDQIIGALAHIDTELGMLADIYPGVPTRGHRD
jgi:hypothetical protein